MIVGERCVTQHAKTAECCNSLAVGRNLVHLVSVKLGADRPDPAVRVHEIPIAGKISRGHLAA